MSQPGCLVPWLTTCFPFPNNRQKEQLSTKGRPFRGMSEEEVFTEVANLFRGQEDLLSEFGQFLPEAKRSLVSTERPPGLWAMFSAGAAPGPGQDSLTPRTCWVPPGAVQGTDTHRPPCRLLSQALPPRQARVDPEESFSTDNASW